MVVNAFHARQAGLTLLEVLVALLVTALFLGIVLPGVASLTQRLAEVREETAAITLARSKIEEYAIVADTVPRTYEGHSDQLAWKVTVRDVPRDDLLPETERLTVLQDVSVEVWRDTATLPLRLSTYRLRART